MLKKKCSPGTQDSDGALWIPWNNAESGERNAEEHFDQFDHHHQPDQRAGLADGVLQGMFSGFDRHGRIKSPDRLAVKTDIPERACYKPPPL